MGIVLLVGEGVTRQDVDLWEEGTGTCVGRDGLSPVRRSGAEREKH